MMKFLVAALVAVFLSTTTLAQNSQPQPRAWSDCLNMAPYGFPQSRVQGRTICRTGYALEHDGRARIATWVAYTIQASHALGCLPRQDQFEADQSLAPGTRGEVQDYRRSGFDMGHLAPNGDMSYDALVQRESFILSNITPQLPGLNRGLWRELEGAVRVWAYTSGGSLTIYTGPIYAVGDPTIGQGVTIPRAFYKIVINNQTRETLAFLFPHQATLPQDIAGVQTTVTAIQSATGIVFPQPDDPNLQRPIWPLNVRSLIQARQSTCRR